MRMGAVLHFRELGLYAPRILVTFSAVPQETLLVIPCYRERDRLPRFLPRLVESLDHSGLPVKVLIVDDGSGEEQQAWLKLWVGDLQRRYPILLPPICNPVNQGKGAAVYTGWNTAEETTAWVGFVDADGAISPEEVLRVIRHYSDAQEGAVWAVRTGEEDTLVRRVFKRKVSGSVFRKLVERLFHFPVPDTQCGFKLVRTEAYRKIAPQLTEMHYCFDIDLTWHLLQAGQQIAPVPISWEESPDSRLGAHSVLAMLRSVLGLKRRLGNWSDRA